MALESGKYTILSKVDGAPVGRRLAEDDSLLPKGIYKLPKDLEADIPIQWDVEKLENGNYKFKATGDVVGAIDGHLVAILLEDQVVDAATEWTLQPDERATAGNAYVVTRAGHQDGWAAPTDDNEQIVIEPILAGFTIPPTYSPREVFVFSKLY